MLFLAAGQQLIVTYEGKDKDGAGVCEPNNEHRRQKDFRAAVLSHNQCVNEQDRAHKQDKSGA
jgi:hypothetical protein